MKLFGFHYSSNTIPFIRSRPENPSLQARDELRPLSINRDRLRPSGQSSRRLILVVVIIFGIYFNILDNSFVWDDEYLVTNNIFIRNPRYIKNIFTEPLFYKSCQANYYRPVQTLSYLFDYHFWKLNPFGYHLTNILIHTLNIMLIFLLINTLFKDKELSLLTSLFFAICPLHVPVVTYISGRADLLVTFFILSALLLFIKSISVKNDLYYLSSIICFLLALFSKELALVFPFILLLTHKVYEKSNSEISKWSPPGLKPGVPRAEYSSGHILPRHEWRGLLAADVSKDFILRYIPIFLFSLVYIILRTTILNFSDSLPIQHQGNFYLRVITFFQVILSYIKLIFLPIHLHMRHSIQMGKTTFIPFALLSLINIVFIIIVIIRSSRRSRIVFWALSWFSIMLLPVYFVLFSYNLYVKDSAMMAEHWLYVPLIGFFTLIAFIALTLNRIRSTNLRQVVLKKTVVLVTAVIVFFYVVQTIKTNADWQDEVTLFSRILRYAPDDTNIQVALARSQLNKGNLDEAINMYKEILRINKNLGYIAHSGLGTAYFKKGNFKDTIDEYKNAISELQDTKKVGLESTQKNPAEIFRNMGIVYFYQGLYLEAENEFTKAIQINPLDAPAYCALGVVFAKQGHYAEAVKNINRSLDIDPYNAETYNNLGLVYANMGDTDKAIQMWNKAICIDPNYQESKRNIQRVLLDRRPLF